MVPTLLWYDLETFGTNPRWDRIGQFAAVKGGEVIRVFVSVVKDIGPHLIAYIGDTDRLSEVFDEIDADIQGGRPDRKTEMVKHPARDGRSKAVR